MDFIVLNFQLPDIDGADLINYIWQKNIDTYKSSIIVYSDKVRMLKEVIKNKYFFSYFSKSSSVYFII